METQSIKVYGKLNAFSTMSSTLLRETPLLARSGYNQGQLSYHWS